MISIGITGPIASGKSTVARMVAGKKYPLFCADQIVTNLYKKKFFIKNLKKIFLLDNKKNIKEQIKVILKKNINNFKKLENIIHPYVRREMIVFLKKTNKIVVFEIPLLFEGKLEKYFNVLIYVGANKKVRLKRYLAKKKDPTIFKLLSKRQLSPSIKQKKSDHTITNNKSLAFLRKNAKNFIKNYE